MKGFDPTCLTVVLAVVIIAAIRGPVIDIFTAFYAILHLFIEM